LATAENGVHPDAADPTRWLPEAARTVLADASDTLYVWLTASAWESQPRSGSVAYVFIRGYERHLRRAPSTPRPVRPVIAATTLAGSLTRVTADPEFNGFNGLQTIW